MRTFPRFDKIGQILRIIINRPRKSGEDSLTIFEKANRAGVRSFINRTLASLKKIRTRPLTSW
ncbi:conserved domain protein [Peptoniphilus sp. oral taxon 375 str. F0436]|nr:conserved domain protein [Peptoniphilus sp. oral taxon 375 str. F0436]